jgi:hypothetical protein
MSYFEQRRQMLEVDYATFGLDAHWQGQPCRVIKTRKNEVDGFGGSLARSDCDVFRVRLSELARADRGDEVTFGDDFATAEVFTVIDEPYLSDGDGDEWICRAEKSSPCG